MTHFMPDYLQFSTSSDLINFSFKNANNNDDDDETDKEENYTAFDQAKQKQEIHRRHLAHADRYQSC